MKFNQKRFFQVLAVFAVLDGCLFMTGCTSAWLATVSSLLPTILGIAEAIVSFVSGLEGKTVPAGTTAAMQKWEQNLANLITNVQSIIAQIKQSATQTLIGELQTGMAAVQTSFSSLLASFNVTDSATVSKLTEFVNLGIAAVNAVLAFIPMVVSALDKKFSDAELKHYDQIAAKATQNAANTIKETYVAIVDEHTVNADVNTALDALPRTI